MTLQAGSDSIPDRLPPSSFGEWLRAERKRRDLTQAELAQRAGCARVTIRKLEADDMRPSKQLAGLLAEALDIPAAERSIFVQFARGVAASETPAAARQTVLPANNLPLQPTSFIGRENEAAEVKRLLAATHLLTLTGPGGTGKTRLSLRVAAEFLDPAAGSGHALSAGTGQIFKDGVWLIELAPLADPALVPATIAEVLDVHEEPGRPLMATLLDWLRAKQLLLILDNCEHLIEACAKFADAVLHASRETRLLATSREALGIAGEQVYLVPSLTMPEEPPAVTAAQLQQFESVRLFVARATAVQPHFQLADDNAAAVAQICRQLDGIPLAIELAAARAGALDAGQIAAHLDDRFRLLTGGSRTALPRQQTLRATVDWGYSLLPQAERILFQRLSVFMGGWTLEAAEEVAKDDPQRSPAEGLGGGIKKAEGGRRKAELLQPSSFSLQPSDVLDLLTRLVDKSLVVADGAGRAGVMRYHLLETMRLYAREKLTESGEGEQMQARHLATFLHFAETTAPKLLGPAQAQWLNRLESEHDNLRAALAWALARGESPAATRSDDFAGVRLCGALERFWWIRGYWSEGRQWLQQALALGRRAAGPAALSSENTSWFAKALSAAGELAASQGDYATARALHVESLELRRRLGDTQGILSSLYNQGNVARVQGDYAAARALFEEGLALSRRLGDEQGIASALHSLGVVVRYQGDFAAARALLEEGLALNRSLGDKQGIAASLQNLGILAYYQGDFAAARAHLEDSLLLSRELGDTRFTSLALISLASVASRHGDHATARALFAEGLTISREAGYLLGVAWCLVDLAGLAQAEGQAQHAVRLLGAHEILLQRIGARLAPQHGEELDHTSAAARAQLGDATFAAAWEEGRALTLEQAIDEALNVELPTERESAAAHGSNHLSPRQRQVLALVAQGLSDAEVAEKLAVSPRTIKTHLANIYRKLGVNSRGAATQYALEHELG